MDLLVTAAESWKILLIGPVLVALIAFGILQLFPLQYDYGAAVTLSEKRSHFLLAPRGIEAILGQEDAGGLASRRAELARFKVSARNEVTGTVDIDVRSSDPRRSQALMSEFVGKLAAWVAADKDATERQTQKKIDAYFHQNELLEKIVGSIASSDLDQSESAGFAAAALTLTSQIRDNQIATAGFNEDLAEARKPPPLAAIMPGQPVNRNNTILILSYTLSLIALITFVFGREAFRKASGNAEVAAKLARIRRAGRWRHS
jgi:hypothetical protein